jgi:hypothetical protein
MLPTETMKTQCYKHSYQNVNYSDSNEPVPLIRTVQKRRYQNTERIVQMFQCEKLQPPHKRRTQRRIIADHTFLL